MNILNYKLIRTCTACPEQYDVFKNNKQVAYLRLRHGWFYASCPDVGGEMVYEAVPRGDGIFFDEERDFYLESAIKEIDKYYERK